MKPAPPSISISPAALGGLLLQWLITSLMLLFVLENEVVARVFVSQPTWEFLLRATGGTWNMTALGPIVAASLVGVGLISLLLCVFISVAAAAVARARHGVSWTAALMEKFSANTKWTAPIAIWVLGWIGSLFFPEAGILVWLVLTVKQAVAATLAGGLWEILREFWPQTSGLSTFFPANSREQTSSLKNNAPRHPWRWLLGGMLVYVIVFVSMNWGLWFNLQLPHGDSSMYEEHLWNVLHGKGFRSYLDQGLFLGEHIQVIHLLLIPLYLLWPSHLLLELCESLALVAGAIPVYWIARRHAGREFAGVALALAYLLYFPMHYLDIAIDLKTFRPSAFGIPALLFMIDAAERRRWGWMSVCIVLALMCQEDFAVAIAPFGVWLLVDGWQQRRSTEARPDRAKMIAGGVLAVLMPVYVAWAVKVAIPWFHAGATVHYASYFQAFGKTPVEIVWNIATNPALLGSHLLTAASLALLLDLLLPLGMPWRGWRQLLVGLPLFVLLCLNELTKDFPGPFHHFHAPLIPILVWAACCGLKTGATAVSSGSVADSRSLWILSCALTTSIMFSLSPVGIAFWDSGSPFFAGHLYVPSERAREFAKILPLIPKSARVASTDFVHPRFTHYERSYDYSHYPRRVADYEDKVPDDTDYIVIDTAHRYSDLQKFEQTREYQRQRDQWEVVPVDTKGYFIVLKRVRQK